MVRFAASQSLGEETESSSDTNLGASVGVGYRTGTMDFRGSLFFPDVGNAGDAYAAVAAVGFPISSL